MNDTIEGDNKPGAGNIESFSAEPLDNREARSRGESQTVAKAQDAAASVQQTLSQVADQARVAASKVAEQAKDAYGRVSESAHDVAGKVDPFVQEQPYAALGLAAAAGLLLGLIMGARAPRIIYLKSKS